MVEPARFCQNVRVVVVFPIRVDIVVLGVLNFFPPEKVVTLLVVFPDFMRVVKLLRPPLPNRDV